MNQQLYLIEPTYKQFQEWKELQRRLGDLAGICQNRMIVTEAELTQHRCKVDSLITALQALNSRTMDVFTPVTLEEAKAVNVGGGSEEVAKILGIDFDPLPF